jgi:hypothetical protein
MFLFIQAHPLMFVTYRRLEMWMIEKMRLQREAVRVGGELERTQIHPAENVQLKNGWKNEITDALAAVAAVPSKGNF